MGSTGATGAMGDLLAFQRAGFFFSLDLFSLEKTGVVKELLNYSLQSNAKSTEKKEKIYQPLCQTDHPLVRLRGWATKGTVEQCCQDTGCPSVCTASEGNGLVF